MNNAIFKFARPANEPIYGYTPGSAERAALEVELEKMSSEVVDIPLIIGGKEVRTGNTYDVVMPHNHKHVIAKCHIAGEKEIQMAIDAAVAARDKWAAMDWIDRASIMLRIAELISKKYRYVMNASTMLGQGKNAFQAEIDSACELIDFLRYNVYFAGQIYSDQPVSDAGIINRSEYRALDGFVFTVSPFNFTAIAGNLNISPVLMGNATVWKPSTTAVLSNYYLMQIFKEAGVPDGVINFVPSKGREIGEIVFANEHFAGVHFTGSTATFNNFWKSIGENISTYRSYPRIVGETGGKDFVMVHSSADAKEVAVALVRGSFEYQGQKCSAASRAYVPASMWAEVKGYIAEMLAEIKVGDVADFSNFVNAVIDRTSFDNIKAYIDHAAASDEAEIVFGGKCDDSVGYFVEPTIIEVKNPMYRSMTEEIFGPVLSLYVYEDDKFEETLELVDKSTPYALTGSILGYDRYAVNVATDKLSGSAGNFYINDKPTGAVVGQQPFGGGRASGTNDKAGSYMNLLRWVSARSIKETLNPPTCYKYPFLAK
ncbi:MAG: L-glutamate gamma-semialdehyde dehydrogenase [Rikenellaceae bacterium]